MLIIDEERQAYKTLWLAVIQQALRDVFWERYASTPKEQNMIDEQKKDAYEWLYSTSCRIGSFNWILDMLCLDRDLKWFIIKHYERRSLNSEGIQSTEFIDEL